MISSLVGNKTRISLVITLALTMALLVTLPAMAGTTTLDITSPVIGEYQINMVTAGADVTFAATNPGLDGVMYHFWVRGHDGNWRMEQYSDSNVCTLTNVKPGTYVADVYCWNEEALAEGQALAEARQVILVDSSVVFTEKSYNDGRITLTAQASNITGDPNYQFWYKDSEGWHCPANFDYSTRNSVSFEATTGQTYEVAVYAKDNDAMRHWKQAAAASGIVKAVAGDVTAKDLNVVIDQLLPGVLNITIPFADAQAKLGATPESTLVLAVQGKAPLELLYNAAMLGGAGGFFKAAVQGYNDAEIKAAVVTIKAPPVVVTARELNVVIDQIVPGVLNVTIPFADAQAKLGATAESTLVLAVQGKAPLELLYNAAVLDGAGGFFKAAVQGYTAAGIETGTVTLK